MMKEVTNVRQVEGEHRRRWFWSDELDLIVWLDEYVNIVGFQLCYYKNGNQKALTWKEKSGYIHDDIEDGESRQGRYKATPILTQDGIFEKIKISDTFKKESDGIEKNISDFIYEKILNYDI